MCSKQRYGKSCSEAGKLGGEKTKVLIQEIMKKRISDYDLNPNICLNCKKQIPYKSRKNKFCSKNCSAIYNNAIRDKGSFSSTGVKTIKCCKCGKDTLVNIRTSMIICDNCRIKQDSKLSTTKICSSCGKEFHGKSYQDKCKSCLPQTFCGFCGKEIPFGRKFCNTSCQGQHTKKEIISAWKNGNNDGRIGKFGDQTSKTIKAYLKKECGGKCAICGQSEWMGKEMPLICDHINGNSLDNSPENLRMICGNCDMQLSTYKSRNKGKGRFSRRQRYHEGKSS